MKKYIVVLFVLFIVIKSYSQTPMLDWGYVAELPKNNYHEKIVGYDKDGFFVLRSLGNYIIDENNIWLDYYSNSSNAVEFSNQILMPTVNGQSSKYIDIFYLSGKLILVTTITEAQKQKKSAYVQILNNDGTLNGKSILAGEISLANKNDETFNISISPDKSKIMITSFPTFEKYTGQPLKTKIFDTDLKEVYSKNIEIPLKDREFTIAQYLCGNNGNIYLNINAEQVSKKKTTTTTTAKEKYDRIVMVFDTQKDLFTPFTVAIEKFIPSEAFIQLDKNENLIVFGMFTPKSSQVLSGVFFQKINTKTLKLELNTTGVFSREMLADFVSERLGESIQDYYNFKIKEIVFMENGNAVLIAEHSKQTTKVMVDPKTKSEETIYYYSTNDLLLASANKDGVIEWTIRVPKNQNSINDNAYFLSYVAQPAQYGNKLKIMYNDSPSNLGTNNASEIKEMKRPVKGLATLLTVYNDGSVDKVRMYENENLKFLFSPKVFIKTNDGFITEGIDGRNFKFATFIFE